jgi:hypothetical protein
MAKYDLQIDRDAVRFSAATLRDQFEKGCDRVSAGPYRACRGPADEFMLCLAAVSRRRITTIEGVGQPGNLHPLGSVCCSRRYQPGIAKPDHVGGSVLAGRLDKRRSKELMSGNICRCGLSKHCRGIQIIDKTETRRG